MTKSKAKPAPSVAASSTPDMRAVLETNGAALAAAMKASEAMLQGMSELNRELMEFAADRLRKNMQISESLMGCHDPAQAFNVQCEHAHQATQAYLEEASRLMGLAAKVSEKCLQPIETQTRETLDQLGKAAQPRAD